MGTGGLVKMDGIAVAREANKAMSETMRLASEREGIEIQSLAAVLPHPGSKRIIQSIAQRLAIDESKIWHTLNDTGNTSSSSIPLALQRYWPQLEAGKAFGLVAFGAGYTSAAAIARRSN